MINRASFSLIFVCVLAWFSGSLAAAEIDARFDHFSTGFPLSGQHVRTACEACHVKGVFKGTPIQCGGCHNGGIAPGKHARHIVSSNTCDDCHTTFAWTGARMDHSTVTSTCKSCHNNSQAPGMPASHFRTTTDCGECHGTLAWSPVRFDHSNTSFALTGQHLSVACEACHVKGKYKGTSMQCSGCHKKKTSHFVSSNACDDCHNTRTWKGAKGFHNNITGRCDVCHGKTATGKPTKHIATSGDCVDCHTTVSWQGAQFNHSNITGRCDACHNGTSAKGKPPVHVVTSSDCNVCHTGTTVWTGAVFTHSSPNYPGNHSNNVTCASCHTGGATVANWTSPAYKPYCAGCHAATFAAKQTSHIKRESPAVYYSVDELKSCANTACHIYQDNDTTFTQIRTPRASHHAVNSGGW